MPLREIQVSTPVLNVFGWSGTHNLVSFYTAYLLHNSITELGCDAFSRFATFISHEIKAI